MRTRLKMLGMALLALSLLAIPSPLNAARARVKATSERTWDPSFKHVTPGTRVIWKNPTNINHNVTAYGGGWSKSSTIAPGERTRKTFKRKGVYTYRCTIHSTLVSGDCNGMCGTIHVE